MLVGGKDSGCFLKIARKCNERLGRPVYRYIQFYPDGKLLARDPEVPFQIGESEIFKIKGLDGQEKAKRVCIIEPYAVAYDKSCIVYGIRKFYKIFFNKVAGSKKRMLDIVYGQASFIKWYYFTVFINNIYRNFGIAEKGFAVKIDAGRP
ncbi:MAG: hypothetical protein INR73_03130 [Williamsia sp.]|nr:hypothetical protein [Williamsia sp.]